MRGDAAILDVGARLNPGPPQAGSLVFARARLAEMSSAVNAAFKAAVQLRPVVTCAPAR